MRASDHQSVIDELDRLIRETFHTLERFEATGMDTQLPDDYDRLCEILDRALKQQRDHTQAMLAAEGLGR